MLASKILSGGNRLLSPVWPKVEPEARRRQRKVIPFITHLPMVHGAKPNHWCITYSTNNISASFNQTSWHAATGQGDFNLGINPGRKHISIGKEVLRIFLNITVCQFLMTHVANIAQTINRVRGWVFDSYPYFPLGQLFNSHLTKPWSNVSIALLTAALKCCLDWFRIHKYLLTLG